MKSLMLGNIEQEVLSIIWSAKRSMTVREVLKQCDEKFAYTTVMTVMSRMAKKGLLKRELDGKSFVYRLGQSRKEYADKHLNSIYHSLVDTYGEFAISQFIDSIKEDKKNLKLLEEYLTKNGS